MIAKDLKFQKLYLGNIKFIPQQIFQNFFQNIFTKYMSEKQITELVKQKENYRFYNENLF